QAISQKYGVKHLPNDFKKKDGYLKSTLLSKQYSLYRQNYCGCKFSKENLS
ncbi:MAG: epoxyqueuosine reductase QueH, partial [Clostridia bacterium]